MDAQGWAELFLVGFGVAGVALVVVAGFYATREMERSRKAGRQALLDATAHLRELERAQQAHIDRLWTEVYGRPQLKAMGGGKVIPFTPPTTKEP